MWLGIRLRSCVQTDALTEENELRTFSCATNIETPLPARNIDAAWRRGLDLEPLQVNDRDDQFLEHLSPAEQDYCLDRGSNAGATIDQQGDRIFRLCVPSVSS